MSDLGFTPLPPQQRRPAAPGPSSTVPIWAMVLVVALILTGGGFLARLLLEQGKASGPTYPKAWDSRILPYTKIAEKQRGLIFKHPVAVRFLPPQEFEKTVTTDDKELDNADRTELKQFTGLMRALGLISGNVDLFAALNDFSGAGTLAYYSFEDKRITVRGQRITPAMRSTLVHELTHVLQDQYFDIGDRMAKLGKDDGPDTGEESVLDAIIEGDATRVESNYRNSLRAKQRKALDAGQHDESAQAMARMKKVPKVVVSMMTSPYTLGEGLVTAVAQDGGNKAVDDLFRDPPTHETALLDPLSVVNRDTSADKVSVPKLGKGEKKFDSGEFGVLTWYFMLAERLPLKEALAAADGWGGDSYVAFQRGDKTCARLAFQGDTGKDTDRMYSDLRQWTSRSPRGSAEVTRVGKVLQLESCDPGTTGRLGKDASENAITLVATRAGLGIGLLKAGAPAKMADCMAGRLTQEYSVAQLANPGFGADDPSVKSRVQQLAIDCRST
jgi:hypothetical protein